MSTILTISKTEQPNSITIEELEKIYNGSLNGLNIQDMYRKFPEPEKFISFCLSKILIDSNIIISGLDIYEASRKIYLGDISLQGINKLLYNDNKNCLSLDYMIGLLESLNCSIVKTYYIKDIEFMIEAKRNG